MTIAIIQPLVPHYREAFLKKLSGKETIDIFVYLDDSSLDKGNFHAGDMLVKKLRSFCLGKVWIYSVFPLLFGRYKVIVLCGEMKLLSNWIILFFARFIGKEVILWGHGINARFYDHHVKRMPFLRKLMYRLADGAWFYTENERKIWQNIVPDLKSIALNNTIDVEPILNCNLTNRKDELKSKYSIQQEINFIFCARFNNANRRADLLVKLIETLDANKYGFIIIGGGKPKPDFSKYVNVYDLGAVYDKQTKDELFSIADIYFQPGALGLSVVEAMAYGKPVFTLKRSDEISHGVEYGYIQNDYNGIIVQCLGELCGYIEGMEMYQIEKLGQNARDYVRKNLTMENMVANAVKGIEMLG